MTEHPPRSATLRLAAIIIGCGAALLALAMVAQRNRIGFDPWPDIVCQLYVGWRIAQGDMLFTTIWDSHPPAAVLLAAVPHLFFAPSYELMVSYLGALAALVAAASYVLLRALTGSSAWLVTAASGFIGAFYYRYLAGARSEDVIIICSMAGIGLCIQAVDHGRRLGTIVVAGVILGFSMLAKPGAVAGALVAGFVVLLLHPRRAGAFAAFCAGVALPIGVAVVWLANGDALHPAYVNVVEYGRSYFRPFDGTVVRAFLGRLTESNLPWLITGWLLAITVGRSAILARLRPVRTGESGRGHTRLFALVFVVWPALELAVSLPQTTMFIYIFFPLIACLMLLTAASLICHVGPVARGAGDATRRMQLPVRPSPEFDASDDWRRATLAALVIGALPLAAAALMQFRGTFLMATLAGVAALSLWLWLRSGARMRSGKYPSALKPSTLSASFAVIAMMASATTLELGSESMIPGRPRAAGHVTAQIDAGRRVNALRTALGGTVLWFDAAPAVAYFARLPNPIPEYLSHPLFLAGFATEASWRRVLDLLTRPHVSLVLVWPEWYDVIHAETHAGGAFPAGRDVAKTLAQDFAEAGRLDLYPGRQPVIAYVRRSDLESARALFRGKRG